MTAVGALPLAVHILVASLFFYLLKWPWWVPAAGIATLWLFPKRLGWGNSFGIMLWLAVAGGFGWGVAAIV